MRSRRYRLYIMLTAILSCATFGGCGKSEVQKQAISVEEFKAYIEEVEITPDNWEQYFSVEEYSVVNRDAFGEETGESYDTYFLNNNKNVCPSNDLVMEFSFISTIINEQFWDKETLEDITTYSKREGDTDNSKECLVTLTDDNFFNHGDPREFLQRLYITREKLGGGTGYNSNGDMVEAWWERTYEISDFKLNRSSGKIEVFNIPEDKWLTDQEHGRYIIISVGDSQVEYLFESGAYALDSIDNINWDDDFRGCSSWSLFY